MAVFHVPDWVALVLFLVPLLTVVLLVNAFLKAIEKKGKARLEQKRRAEQEGQKSSDLNSAQERLDLAQHRPNPRDFREDGGHDDLQRSFASYLVRQHGHHAICGSV